MTGLEMKYFVLKPHGTSPYANASRIAMSAYAQAIESENPELARQLYEWYEFECTDFDGTETT